MDKMCEQDFTGLEVDHLCRVFGTPIPALIPEAGQGSEQSKRNAPHQPQSGTGGMATKKRYLPLETLSGEVTRVLEGKTGGMASQLTLITEALTKSTKRTMVESSFGAMNDAKSLLTSVRSLV